MNTKFDELMQDQEFKKLYAVEKLIGDTADMIWQLLEQKDMKQADLAKLLNKTPAFVSQLLNGKANMTVRTLAEVVHALGASVRIEAIDGCSNLRNAEESHRSHTFHLPETRIEKARKNVFLFEDIESQKAVQMKEVLLENRSECVA
jgi:transcriptional regulator with XRE-family HTH domain